MFKSKQFTTILTASGIFVLGAHLVAQQEETKTRSISRVAAPLVPEIKSLIEARIATAGEIYRAELRRLTETHLLPAEDLGMWSRQWMDDQLRLGSGPTERIAALQAHLGRVKRVEELTDNYAKVGQGRPTATPRAKYLRLEAEQMLAEARAAYPEIPLPGAKNVPE